MANELYETATLIEAVNSPDLKVRPRFFRETLFPNEDQIFSEIAKFEVEQTSTGLAKFNVLGREANVVNKTPGAKIITVEFPNIREKKPLTAKELRGPAELGKNFITGAQDITALQEKRIGKELADLKNRILRREEWMISELLRTGKIQYRDTETGASFEIDLGMGSDFFPTAATLWTAAGADIDGNLEAWSNLIEASTGVPGQNVILGKTAAAAFRKNADVKKNLDNNNYRAGQLSGDLKARYIGNYAGFDFWKYTHAYTKDDASAGDFMPANMAIMTSANFADENEMLYGIHEELEETVALPFYSKSWTENDPPVRWLLAASRPLPCIRRAGSFVSATVTA
jgi:hypothetical protein